MTPSWGSAFMRGIRSVASGAGLVVKGRVASEKEREKDPQWVLLRETAVTLRPWETIREQGRALLLGCPSIKTFIEIDEDTLRAIEALDQEGTVARAEAKVREETGEDFDIHELAEYLLMRGFISSLNGDRINERAEQTRGRVAFPKLRPEQLTWIRSLPVAGLVLGMAVLATLIMVLEPGYTPSLARGLTLGSTITIVLASFAIMMGNAFLHECAHILVARSHGVDGYIKWGRRFHVIVMESDVSNAWKLDSKWKRIQIYSAGMAFNILAASTALFIAYNIGTGALPGSPLLVDWLLFYAALHQIPLIFQLLFWIRTDIYYILMEFTGERNLRLDARKVARAAFAHLGQQMLRRTPKTCPACSFHAMPTDWFCFQCNEILDEEHEDAGLVNPRKWRFMTIYTMFTWIVTPLLVLFMVQFVLIVQQRIAYQAIAGMEAAIATGAFVPFASASLVLVISLLQFALVIWAFGMMIKRLGMFLWSLVPRAREATAI